MSSDGYIVYGRKGWYLASIGELQTDRKGLETCTAVFKCDPKSWRTGIPRVGQPHPEFTWMTGVKRRLSVNPREFAQVTMEYEGSEETEVSVDGETAAQYELVAGVTEELIATHPNFITDIGGKPTAPINGAVFVGANGAEYFEGNPAPDENARFSHFSLAIGPDRNPLAAIEAYLDLANIEWRKSWVSANIPSGKLNKGGKIDTPDGPCPAVSANRTWLHLGLQSRQRGKIWDNTESWRPSGRGGWNELIYV